MTESGKPVFVPLNRVRTHRNIDKRGTFRWYNDYRLPEHLGGGVVTVRLHANAEDAKRKLLNMITHALGVNALSMHMRRQGLAPPREA